MSLIWPVLTLCSRLRENLKRSELYANDRGVRVQAPRAVRSLHQRVFLSRVGVCKFRFSNCRSVYCVVNVLTVSEYKVLPEASAIAPTVSVY